MAASESAFKILDLFYEKDGREPDWAALLTELYATPSPETMLQILKTLWAVYEIEDFAVIKTNIFTICNPELI